MDDSDSIPVDLVTTPSTSASEYEDTFRGLDAIRNLMTCRAPSTPSSASSSFAQLGNLVTTAITCLSHSSFPWIIDFGASNHISSSFDLFFHYTPYTCHDKIRIADGPFSSIS